MKRSDLISRDASLESEQSISHFKPSLMTKFFDQQNDIKKRAQKPLVDTTPYESRYGHTHTDPSKLTDRDMLLMHPNYKSLLDRLRLKEN